ncbi:hypothetical protein F4680DRAFT_194204 [Xylaria scruposa]|nr:hypothetical protein F4680DRAFT_194204 [Xylaria scruposa]
MRLPRAAKEGLGRAGCAVVCMSPLFSQQEEILERDVEMSAACDVHEDAESSTNQRHHIIKVALIALLCCGAVALSLEIKQQKVHVLPVNPGRCFRDHVPVLVLVGLLVGGGDESRDTEVEDYIYQSSLKRSKENKETWERRLKGGRRSIFTFSYCFSFRIW